MDDANRQKDVYERRLRDAEVHAERAVALLRDGRPDLDAGEIAQVRACLNEALGRAPDDPWAVTQTLPELAFEVAERVREVNAARDTQADTLSQTLQRLQEARAEVDRNEKRWGWIQAHPCEFKWDYRRGWIVRYAMIEATGHSPAEAVDAAIEETIALYPNPARLGEAVTDAKMRETFYSVRAERDALAALVVRERTHPECPADQRWTLNIGPNAGRGYPTREAALAAIYIPSETPPC